MSKVDQASADYPVRLMTLASPPSTLWFAGSLPAAGTRAVAIVGSRAASTAGCGRARQLAGQAARRGWAVISGGAFGIDAAAHEGALGVGAATYAVLGCGADVTYPDRHRALFGRIERSGGLLSEYPPGTQPRPGQFPARNRLIVALSDVVIVVEAARRSGALITARLAAALPRPVLAVAGSPGTDDLLASGAATEVGDIDDVEDVLAGRVRPTLARDAGGAAVPSRFAALVDALRRGPHTADALAREMSLPVAQIMGTLMEAELEGWIRRGPFSRYEVHRGH